MRRRSRAGGKPNKTRRRKATAPSRPSAPKVSARRNPSSANANTKNALLKRERDEALEREKATAEVLHVISSSPGELEPVFQAMLENATHICEAKFGILYRFDGEALHLAAGVGLPPELAEFHRQRGPFQPRPGTQIERVVRTKQVGHTADADAAAAADTASSAPAKFGGARTIMAVPMLKDDTLVGVISIYRQEVRPFTDKQITLVTNFAAQAVIAIENARLLNELRQRTGDLTEALEQQTATAEILGVISKSLSDTQPVFDAIVQSGVRLFSGAAVSIALVENGMVKAAAVAERDPVRAELWRRRFPIPLTREYLTSVAILDRKILDIPNVENVPEEMEVGRRNLRETGYRAATILPLMRGEAAIGALSVLRIPTGPLSEKQLAALKNYAKQAEIAIENARLLNELRESLEQQTATSEVLRVISSSPGELEPVFEAMLQNAVHVCDAKFGNIFRWGGDSLHLLATHNTPRAFAEARRNLPFRPGPDTLTGRMVATKSVTHVADLAAELGYAERDPLYVESVEVGGIRTLLSVPMLKENELIGALTIYRQDVRPFSDKQIELVRNFAAQAVIAIENTRLLNALRQSLEQQTATADVLRVISSSPGDLEPVFGAMLENAIRICEANFGNMFLIENGMFRTVAMHNAPAAYANARTASGPFRPPADSGPGRLVSSKDVVHITDLKAEETYLRRDPFSVAGAELAGIRTLLAVPMLKDDALIGAIVIYRQEVRPFTDKQIDLVRNFAAQAVIAIENTRLLNELRQRTDDLTESLEQQTATSKVLSVISSSPANIQPVLEIIGERAEELCDAEISVVSVVDGELIRLASINGVTLAGVEAVRRAFPMRDIDETITARAIRTRSVCHVADVLSDPQYQQKDTARVSGYRGCLGMPMVRDEHVVGAIFVARRQPGLFSDAQVQLLKTFADQAVIAVENVRLFNEIKTSLEQQTATADVLKVISRSTFDLQVVLNTLIESATRLCEADMGSINRQSGDAYRQVANYGHSPELQAYMDRHPIPAGHGSVVGRTVMAGGIIHIPDVFADPDYKMAESARIGGIHTMLGVPLLREGTPIGVIVLQRKAVRPFTEKQIELVTTFADQAVIAIENVRLFDEIQDKSRQLEVASQHKSQFLANMSHELRTPLNAILGYTELIADGIYGEPSEKMLTVLKRLESNGKHLLGLINDVLDLSKIEAGQLVLELSDYSLEDIAQTVRSTLEPLAADKKLAFKVDVAPNMPAGHGDGRRLTQVVINLVGNAIKFTDAGEVVIKATESEGSFHLSVRDTGPGISAADQTKLFQEFQQADNAITRKKGGTGLGLAISKRIIEMHGGKIWVESQIRQGSTFSFTVPVRAAPQVVTA